MFKSNISFELQIEFQEFILPKTYTTTHKLINQKFCQKVKLKIKYFGIGMF